MDKKIIIFFAFALLLGMGGAWAQSDPCAKTYNTCSGGDVVLTHDATCGNGGQYVWAALEDDGNYFYNGVYTAPTTIYTATNFGTGGIGGGWGDGENPANLAYDDENRCHYPGSMTVDIKNSTSNNPYIYFPISGGADPNIYRYFIIRYRVNYNTVNTNLGNMELYFFNSNNTNTAAANTDYRVLNRPITTTSTGQLWTKCSTDGYETVYIDAWANGNWRTGGNITGFRLDPISVAPGGYQVHMSIDYIGLVSAIPPSTGNNTLTVNNVTANTTMKSYQINFNGSVAVTKEANSNTHMHNAAGVIYYGWTSTESTHTVQVYPALNAGAIATDAVSRCEGDNTAVTEIGEVTAATHEAGATLSYKWYVSKDGGTPAVISGATSNLFTPDITTYNTVPGTYVFTREVISDLCEASPKTSEGSFTLTVKAKPTMTVSDQTFYTNDGVKTVEFTSTPAGATFAWSNNNTAIGLDATGTGNVGPFTPATSGPDDEVATITVTPTLDGCPGTTQNFTITVKNSVTMNDITTFSATACSGNNVTATFTSPVSDVTYKWSHTNTNVTPANGTVDAAGAFSQAFTNATSSEQTVTFSVTPTKVIGGSNVDGPAKTFTVTIYPLPVVSITGESTVCPKSTNTFTGTTTTTTGDYTFTWDGGGDGFLITPSTITQSATTHEISAKAPSNCDQTFTITLTVEDGHNCSNTSTKDVLVKDATAPTIGDVTVPAAEAAGNCQYAIPDLESAVIAATTDGCNGTITWVSQSIAAGTKYDQGAIAQNITVTVNVKDACNNPQSKTVTVTIPANDLAVNATANPTAMCLELSSALSASVTGGLGTPTYAWSSTSTGAGMPTTVNTASINVTPTAAGAKTYTVSVTDGNGCSKTKDVAVTVYELPTIDATNATQNITYGDAIADIVISKNTESTVTLSPSPAELAAIGLAYDDATQTISGKPNTVLTDYTITATATSTHGCGADTKVITLNVGKKNLTITYTGTENTKVYDGTPLTISYDKLTYTGLVTGDEITSGVITTDGYKVGTYVCNAGSFSRMWADGTASPSGFGPASVTQNYSVQFNVTLSITVRPLEITANSASKEYDATPLTDPGYSYTNGTSLASTDEATVTVEGSQLCPGSSNNTITAVTIKHTSDNVDVTDCYDITLKKGKLTVTSPDCPTTLDYAGYTYPIVQVGDRCWFAENLRAEIGDAVPYDENSANTPKFGLLYNWTDALNGHGTKETEPCFGDFVQGACPEGWSLPSAADFEALKTAAGDDMKAIRSDNATYWIPEYIGTNSTNFDERGGGLFNASTNRFEELRSAAYFWTCESILNPDAYAAGMALSYVDEYYCSGKFIPKIMSQNSKQSVRCIRNIPIADLPISFNLDVTGPDKFTICSGSTTPVTATYEAVVTPDATPVTYQWYVNGSAVPGANSATFVTTYTSADEGTTVVKCEATAGGTTEDGTVTTQILVKGPYSAEKTLEVCDCKMPYTYTMTVGTDTWTETWTMTSDHLVVNPTRSHTFVTADGCDSVVNITLTTWSAGHETPTTCTSVTTYNANETGNGSGLETVTDYDGNVYHVVQIGNQCWMKENLRVTHFANGTALEGVSTVDQGNRADIYYTTTKTISSLGPCDGTITMDEHTQRYGLLYNWYTAMGTNTPSDDMHNVQGICPNGWHLPDTTEWHTFEAAVGITGVHSENAFLGTNAIQIVTGCEWHESTVSGSVGDYTASGRNATGFSARPAGCFFDKDVTETVLGTTWTKDDIAYAGVWCFFWSSTKYNKPGFDGKAAYNYDLHFDKTGISRDVNGADYLIGRSVRCIRNN